MSNFDSFYQDKHRFLRKIPKILRTSAFPQTPSPTSAFDNPLPAPFADVLRVRPLRFSTKMTALTQIVNCFWNDLSADVICKESVKSFKSKLDSFRLKGYKENRIYHLWEFSDDV